VIATEYTEITEKRRSVSQRSLCPLWQIYSDWVVGLFRFSEARSDLIHQVWIRVRAASDDRTA